MPEYILGGSNERQSKSETETETTLFMGDTKDDCKTYTHTEKERRECQ